MSTGTRIPPPWHLLPLRLRSSQCPCWALSSAAASPFWRGRPHQPVPGSPCPSRGVSHTSASPPAFPGSPPPIPGPLPVPFSRPPTACRVLGLPGSLPERSLPIFPSWGARPGLRGCHPLPRGCVGQSRVIPGYQSCISRSRSCAWPRQSEGGGEWPGLAHRDAQAPFPLRIAPALLRQASYGTIKIGIYQSLKRLFVDRMEGRC